MAPRIHQFDPNSRPDSDYEPGSLAHLVPGNRGRLLDPRRTPVRVVALDHATGQFTVEIEAFKDAGALWLIPYENAARHYQFERGCARADAATVAAIVARSSELDRPLEIACDPDDARRVRVVLARMRGEAADWIAHRSRFFASGAALDTTSRTGAPELWDDLRDYFAEHALGDLEDAFTVCFVSNPHSGECVKGHRIVLAELGLAPYRGTIVRDPAVFDGAWSRRRRAQHLLRRLAFVHAMLQRAGRAAVTLYRGLWFDGVLEERVGGGFVSTSFDEETARSCYAPGQSGSNGILMRQVVPIERVFMTYLETAAMNQRFHEAEAVLLHEDGNPLF